MSFKLFNIAVVLWIGFATASAEFECCSEGDFLLSQNECWNPLTNATNFMDFKCSENQYMVRYKDYGIHRFIVSSGGKLVFDVPNRDVSYDPGTYCIAHRANPHNLSQTWRAAVLCIEKKVFYIEPEVNGYCLAISAICLMASAVIYVFFEKVRDLQWLSTINICVCLSLGSGILSIMKLMSYSDMMFCAVRGFLTYFFLMEAFFWMNVYSIHMFLSVRNRNEMSNDTEHKSDKGMFWGPAYAWGVPFVLTIITATVNFMPGEHYKPGIGLNDCWFFDKYQQWIYMYSVMLIIILINVFVFIYCMITMWVKNAEFKWENRVLTSLRLFLMMGLPWTVELMTSVLPHHMFWDVLDLLNALQGVFIFIVLAVTVWIKRERRRSIPFYIENITSTYNSYHNLYYNCEKPTS